MPGTVAISSTVAARSRRTAEAVVAALGGQGPPGAPGTAAEEDLAARAIGSMPASADSQTGAPHDLTRPASATAGILGP